MSGSPLQQRRRTAQLLRELVRQVVTVDVDDAELRAVADALEPLRDRLASEPRLQQDVDGLHTKDRAGRHAGRTPIYDRDPLIGLSNPLSPPLAAVEGTDRKQWEVVFGDAYAGHPGFVHGGYVSAVIDHVLGVVSSSSGAATMTGTLTTRYLRPTPLNTRLICRGELERVDGRKVFCKATLEANDTLIVEAHGVYIRVNPDRY
jgi:acyl-coenzyme A thioesterase PaaI-like protein